MKKFLPFVFLLALINESNAQYHPVLSDSTHWCMTFNYMPVRSWSYDRIWAVHDTLIDTVLYKKVYRAFGSNPGAYYGAMREDTSLQRVYFIYDGSSAEELMYDFSLSLGDTMYVDLHNNTYGNLNDGNYIVDSVSMMNTRGGLRKYIRLHNPMNVTTGPSGKPLKLEWIESVGALNDPVYLYGDDEISYGAVGINCGFDYNAMVTRQVHDTTKDFVADCVYAILLANPGEIFVADDTCTIVFGGGVNELSKKIHISVYPNPSNGNEITIEADNYPLAGVFTCTIHDETGRTIQSSTVKQNSNAIKLTGLNLPRGVYFISIANQKTVFEHTKLIVKP